MSNNRVFPAKVFLFGEYTVLNGSRAFAVPLRKYSAQLAFGSDTDPDLRGLADYLDTQNLFSRQARDRFREGVKNGLCLHSDIPAGYGVGSSGALSAAVYEFYFQSDAPDTDIIGARTSLAAIESFFHGKSSGMDPMVSYYDAPVLRENSTDHVLRRFRWPEEVHGYLVDSGIRRNSEHLIGQYNNRTADEQFQYQCLRPLMQSVDHAISFLIDFHADMFWAHVKQISDLQYRYFKPMICGSVESQWKMSLDHSGIAMKLCGAGGGGYYLAFAKPGSDISEITDTAFRFI